MRRRLDTVAICVLVIVLLWELFPIFWMISLSFKKYVDIIAMPPRWIFHPTMKNYTEVIREKKTPFHFYFLNSVFVGLSSTAIALLVGIPAAYGFSRFRFPGKRDLKFWVLTTRMAPPIAVLIPYFVLFHKLKLIDRFPSLVLVHVTINLALVVWMMMSFIQEIPRELEEAALIDGCSNIGAFLRITLPLIAPGVAAVAVLAFIFSWNDLLFALVLSGRRTATAPVVITSFISYQEVAWGKLSAASTLIMLPVILFALLVQKYIVRGLTLGAIKG